MIVNRHVDVATGIAPSRAASPLALRRRVGLASAALGLLVSGLASGCGASRPVKYYQLTASGVAPTNSQPLPLTIIVNLPSAPALYRDNRVVYSTGDQEIGAYEYARWAGPPAELIRDVFLRQLRSSGRYAGVYTPQGKTSGDYALRTRIYDFKEQDSGDTVSARLAMDAELQDLKTGETVWEHSYTYTEPSAAKNLPDVVAAMNKTVLTAANEVSAAMDQYFAAHPPK